MPSQALGTLAISSVGGGQEGYDLTASSNDHSARPQSSDHSTASLRHNLSLQPLDTRAAQTLSSATTIDVSNPDGVQERAPQEQDDRGLRTSLHINSAIQDSPAHDFHVHTEAANAQHAHIKAFLASKEEELHNMTAAESPGGAQSAAVAQASLENTLNKMENNTAGGAEESAHIERTMSTDERPNQNATESDAARASVATATPLLATQSSATNLETAQSSSTPALNITLLLPTGARHAFRITESYLTKRGVSIPGTDDKGNKDVFSISIYQIKELILREWKEEWGGETTVGPPPAGDTEVDEVEQGRMRGKPSSPSAIRLIFFGRLLGDNDKAEGKPTSTYLLSVLSFRHGGLATSLSKVGEGQALKENNRLQIQQDMRERGTYDSPPTRCG